MPRKIRNYKAELIALGFVQRRGKGNPQNWKHPQLQLLITIAFQNGEDTPLYLEKLLKQAIQELETILQQRNQRNELPLYFINSMVTRGWTVFGNTARVCNNCNAALYLGLAEEVAKVNTV